MEGVVILIILSLIGIVFILPTVCLVILIRLKNQQEKRLTSIESKLQLVLKRQEAPTVSKESKRKAPESPPLKKTEPAITPTPPPLPMTAEVKSEEAKISNIVKAPEPQPLKKTIEHDKKETKACASPKQEALKSLQPIEEAKWTFPDINENQREKTEFEKKALEILIKIWMWIIVGDDSRKEGVAVEYAVATTWLVRSAIVIILTGIAFFLKYSIEKNLLPPEARVCIAVITGIGMLLAGLKIVGRKYRVIGMGLIGGGIATLYFSIFAAANMYHLIETLTAFGLMALITFTAGILSVRLNSLLVAILGVIGGYCTPVMLSTGTKNFEGLFGYLLLLGLGTLYIAKHKDWKLLNFLSFIFTYALFFLALINHYRKPDFPIVITFLSLFFLLFSAIPLLHNIMKKEKISLLELLAMLANTALYLSFSYNLITQIYDRSYVAIVSVSLAAFYILQIMLFIRRKINDRNLLIILSSFASFCITLTVPLVLSGEWITAAWAIQGLVFLWMSGKIKSNFIRLAAYIVYGIAVFRLMSLDFANDFIRTSPDYLDGLISRFTSMGILAASLCGGYWLLKREGEEKGNSLLGKENDIGKIVQGSAAAQVFFWSAFGFLFLFLHFEFYNLSRNFYTPMQMPLLTSIWLTAILFFVAKFRKTLSDAYIALISIFCIGLFIKLYFFDLPFWTFSFERFIYRGDYSFEAAAMRLLDFVPAAAVFAYGVFIALSLKRKNMAEIFGAGAIAVTFLYLTFELNTFLSCYVPNFRAGGISVLWGVFALSAIAWGIVKRIKSLRYAGLILFTVTAVKIFFYDLSSLSQVYRIVAFILLGLVMLGGAFIYIRFKDSFDDKKED